MESLLGQFYNRIKGSQEDIASESLTYILRKSAKARLAINQIIELNTGLTLSDLTYRAQNSGDKLERPDISAINENGKEVLLIEAKFWASLTKKQPNEYIKRLKDNSVIIFLVPTLRERVIYEEILFRISQQFSDIERDTENLKIKLNRSNKFILIKSWNKILNTIKTELTQENNQTLISDIDQIIGFCETIDSNSFQPIIDSDLSPEIAKRIISYYDIVDKVVDELKNRNKKVSTKGLQKTPQRFGYVRYFSIESFGMGLFMNMEHWSKYADTPFWLSVVEIRDGWKTSEKFNRYCEKIAFKLNHNFVDMKSVKFSLKPKLYETEDLVVDDLANQIEEIYKEIEKYKILYNNEIEK